MNIKYLKVFVDIYKTIWYDIKVAVARVTNK
jgi:hypothetical protein